LKGRIGVSVFADPVQITLRAGLGRPRRIVVLPHHHAGGTLLMLALYVIATIPVFFLTAYRILVAKAKKAPATA